MKSAGNRLCFGNRATQTDFQCSPKAPQPRSAIIVSCSLSWHSATIQTIAETMVPLNLPRRYGRKRTVEKATQQKWGSIAWCRYASLQQSARSSIALPWLAEGASGRVANFSAEHHAISLNSTAACKLSVRPLRFGNQTSSLPLQLFIPTLTGTAHEWPVSQHHRFVEYQKRFFTHDLVTLFSLPLF